MKYDFRYDIIRTIAIIFVICIHSMGWLNSATDLGAFTLLTKSAYDSIIYTGVPLFVMLSGALLLGKDEQLSLFFKKRFKRILIPFLIWSIIIYAILYIQEGGRSFGGYIYSFTSKTLGQGIHNIYWYIYLILGLYLITPLLRKMLINGDKTIAYYATLIPFTFYFFSRLFPQCSLIERFTCENLLYIGYFIAGYVIVKYIREKNKVSVLLKQLLAFSLVLNIILHITMQHNIIFQFMTVLTSLLLFTSIITDDKLKIKDDNKSLLIKGVKFISGGSYCIYITHFMIISVMVKSPFMQTIPLSIEPIIMTMIILIAECIMIAILKKIKLNKYLM